MKKVGVLIPHLIKGLGLEEAMRLELIRKEWSTIFREPLSLHMAPALLRSGELLISVDSPVWLQQISLFKAAILENLRTFDVKEVRFRIGRVRAKKRGQDEIPPREKNPLGRDAMHEIDDTVSGLKDTDLRESVRRAMEQSFRTTGGSQTRRKDR